MTERQLQDFLHDNFKANRSWSLPTGWVFHIGGTVIHERGEVLANAKQALERCSPNTTVNHEWKPDGWTEQRKAAIDGLK